MLGLDMFMFRHPSYMYIYIYIRRPLSLRRLATNTFGPFSLRFFFDFCFRRGCFALAHSWIICIYICIYISVCTVCTLCIACWVSEYMMCSVSTIHIYIICTLCPELDVFCINNTCKYPQIWIRSTHKNDSNVPYTICSVQ